MPTTTKYIWIYSRPIVLALCAFSVTKGQSLSKEQISLISGITGSYLFETNKSTTDCRTSELLLCVFEIDSIGKARKVSILDDQKCESQISDMMKNMSLDYLNLYLFPKCTDRSIVLPVVCTYPANSDDYYEQTRRLRTNQETVIIDETDNYVMTSPLVYIKAPPDIGAPCYRVINLSEINSMKPSFYLLPRKKSMSAFEAKKLSRIIQDAIPGLPYKSPLDSLHGLSLCILQTDSLGKISAAHIARSDISQNDMNIGSAEIDVDIFKNYTLPDCIKKTIVLPLINSTNERRMMYPGNSLEAGKEFPAYVLTEVKDLIVISPVKQIMADKLISLK